MYITRIKKWLGYYPVFWIINSLFYALIFTTIDFAGSPVSSFKGFLILASQWFVVALCSAGVIGLISSWRTVFAITYPLLILCSAILAYFRLTMGISLTPMAIELAVVNNLNTWATVISRQLVMTAAISLILSIIPVIWRWKYVRPYKSLDYAILSILIIALPGGLIPRIRMAVSYRMPYVFYSSVIQYLDSRKNIAEQRDTYDQIPVDYSAPQDSIDVILVIGESLRSDHLQLNGYDRPTTPRLAREKNLISFPGMYTEPYYTHTSVPRIMTRADSLNPDRAYNEQSFITLFRKAGYHTLWISNQDITSSYAYFMHEADTLLYVNSGKSFYDFDRWMDIDLLPHFSKEAMKHKRNLTVIHSIGSHWWYNAHYDVSSAIFHPTANSRILSELTNEQMINSYDNTIVETDRFLSGLINMIRHRNAILIFISDHGEALGENGNYLHADDYPQLHYPAAFVWWSDTYGLNYPDLINALRKNSPNRHTTDEIFHSVIDAGRINTPVYNPQLSLLKYEENCLD